MINKEVAHKKIVEIIDLVEEKNIAYNDSTGKVAQVLQMAFPSGISPERFHDLVIIIQILNKIFRVTGNKDAFQESPYQDIIGYCILALDREQKEKENG